MQKFEKHSPVVVTEVTTKHELRQFMQYPNRLYADNPNYIPSFYGDDLSDWTPGKNPAFDYCEARCWLAWRDGEIVGRIGAILSHKANDKFGTHRMRFSQVDFVDDSEVSAALFGTVERWARQKGCDQVHGPLGFTDMDREGMLVEGFDRRSLFFTNYNAPYYLEHLTRLGYRKDVDWIEYRITVPAPGSAEAERLHKLSEFILKRKNLHVATVHHKSEYGPFVRQVFELVNAAYAPLYGVVELSDEQIERYANKFIPLVDPEFVCFVLDEQENLVAFGVTTLDPSPALKHSDGRLFPFGWAEVLNDLHHGDTLIMLLTAVRPDLQTRGHQCRHDGSCLPELQPPRCAVCRDRAHARAQRPHPCAMEAARERAAQAPPLLHQGSGSWHQCGQRRCCRTGRCPGGSPRRGKRRITQTNACETKDDRRADP